MPDGSTYKPKGALKASLSLPMSEEAAKSFLQLAKTAHNTRNFKDAMALYDRCLTFYRDKLGPDDPFVASILHNLSRVFIDLKDFKQAEVASTEAARIYEKVHGTDSLKYADTLGLLALCYREMTLYKDSEETFKKSLRIFRNEVYDFTAHSWVPNTRVAPPNPNEHPLSTVAHLLSDCATLFLYMQELDRALAFLEDALEIRRYLYGKEAKFKPIIAQTLTKVSEVHRTKGTINLAEDAINEALDICIETLGRDTPATAAAYSSKGNCHSVKQEYRQALKCYQEAVTTYAMSFGKMSPLVAGELLKVGRMHEMMNDLKEAEKQYQKSMGMTKEVLGAEHVQMADAKTYLASVYMKQNKIDKAIPLLREGITIRSKVNKNDPALIFSYHRLADALLLLEDPEAEAHFLQAIELHRLHAADNNSRRLLMTDCLDDLGLFYVYFKYFDKAEETLKEAREIRVELLGDSHPTVGYSYSNQGVLHLARGEYRDGAKMAELALETYAKAKVEQQMAVGDAYMTAGQCLHGMGDLQGAKSHHSRCLNIRRKEGEQAELSVAEVLNELARVCIDQEQMGEASDHLAEAFKIAEKFNEVSVRLRENLKKTQSLFQKNQAAIPPGPDHPLNKVNFPDLSEVFDGDAAKGAKGGKGRIGPGGGFSGGNMKASTP